MGLSTYGREDAPESFKAGMNGNMAINMVMWKCNSWAGGDQCKFDHLNYEDLETQGKRKLSVVGKAMAGDACNQFADCHKCITASIGNIKCGWCLGGVLNYKGVGPTSFKCGGFAAGQPYNFTCPVDFRTVDCKGYACDQGTQKCSISDDGSFPDLASCAKICQQTTPYAKCNTQTKKCDIKCNRGEPDCYNRDYCDIACDAPKAKCNPTTGKCEDCDMTKDPNCKQLKTNCELSCTST